MASKLIELEDGILMEVDVPEDQLQQISGGSIDRVDRAIDTVKPILLKACKPITAVWDELNKDMEISEATVEIGLGFEASGNVFIAKGTTNASLKISLKLKPKTTDD
ncbi:MAG: hypothetical protein GQ569_02355 [Methylococcaceae bacterium]|nr:hypothetical protein [Methylococcaceae bacterium]